MTQEARHQKALDLLQSVAILAVSAQAFIRAGKIEEALDNMDDVQRDLERAFKEIA